MKKFIAMVTAIVVVMGLGVTALAETDEYDDYDEETVISAYKGTSLDDSIIVEVYDTTLTSEQQDKLSAFETEDTNTEVCDVRAYLKSTGDEITQFPDGLKVSFTFNGADKIERVLVWNGAGWDDAAFSGNVVTFSHLCPVAFLVKKAATNTNDNKDKTSAQTGYDGVIYIVSAAALAAGAVFFFSTAKKQTSKEEM
ncbi:MAG: hypothetical protein K5881_05965 [Saccharofermentans sp.]|nr:hypothetical protein [Saccharofermentans sp.]